MKQLILLLVLLFLIAGAGAAQSAILFVCPINGSDRTYNPAYCVPIADGLDPDTCRQAARRINAQGGKVAFCS